MVYDDKISWIIFYQKKDCIIVFLCGHCVLLFCCQHGLFNWPPCSIRHPPFPKTLLSPNGLKLITHMWWWSSLCSCFHFRPGYPCRHSSRSCWRTAGLPPLRCGWWWSGWMSLWWPESAPPESSTLPRVLPSILPRWKCSIMPGHLQSAMRQGLGEKRGREHHLGC